MPQNFKEPYTKTSFNIPNRILDRLDNYPGDRTWKIIQLIEFGLEAGALMGLEEAREIAYKRAMTLLEEAKDRGLRRPEETKTSRRKATG